MVEVFLGHARYYRRFIKKFSKIATPLFLLLHKDNEFHWRAYCEKDFTNLKERLMITPILRGSNWNLSFHIHIDASNLVVGVVLGQEEEDKTYYAIYYISKTWLELS